MSTDREAEITRLTDLVQWYEAWAADVKRLTRTIDVELHGEDGAAKQASLCDLVGPSADLRKRAEAAEAALAQSRAETQAALAGCVKIKPLVYVASKAIYGPEWRKRRDEGYPILASWIDQCGVGEPSDWPALWDTCISEASEAHALVLICRDGDTLKGAWAEVGAALSSGRRVFAAGIEKYSIRHHPMVTACRSEEDAFSKAKQFATLAAIQPDTSKLALVRERIGMARLLTDTGASQLGETVDYSPKVVAAILGHLDAALALITAQEEPRHD